MCGIFAIVNDKTNQAAQTTLSGLKKLEYRGYDSWGIALIPSGENRGKKITVEKHVGKIGQAVTHLPNGDIAIGHTRWATHGGVTDKNAHPHLDCKKQVAVIHNGIVENYQEIKSDLISKGHSFTSETDTEVIAHLIEEKSKTKPIVNAVFETFKSLVGSNAIVVLDSKTESIIACRNGSPLVVGIGAKEYFLGSDVPAFLKSTNKVHFLNDGEAVVMNKKKVALFDLKSEREKSLDIQTLDWKMEDAEKGGFPHFLLKEIVEQKNTLPKTGQINKQEFQKIAAKINEGCKIIMSACGTASYCTLAAKYFFSDLGIESEVYGAYEFLPFARFCNEKTVFIAVSQSGETADTLIAARAAKKQGAYIVAVVNARGSTLERLADSTLSVGAGPEIAVVSTKAFTAQLSTLYLLAHYAINKPEKGISKIYQLGKSLEKWINTKLFTQITKLAATLINNEDLYLIGKHLNYPASLEFALKIKESSYIHSEAFAAGELKHGVITLIQKGTPCFVLSSNDNTKDEVLSSAAELKARGGKIIGVSTNQSPEFDIHIKTPDLDELTFFPNVIVGQLMGYYLGIGRGADPDKPRNLAKSVTVK